MSVPLIKTDLIHLFQNVDEPTELILAYKPPADNQWRKLETFQQYKNKYGQKNLFKEIL